MRLADEKNKSRPLAMINQVRLISTGVSNTRSYFKVGTLTLSKEKDLEQMQWR